MVRILVWYAQTYSRLDWIHPQSLPTLFKEMKSVGKCEICLLDYLTINLFNLTVPVFKLWTLWLWLMEIDNVTSHINQSTRLKFRVVVLKHTEVFCSPFHCRLLEHVCACLFSHCSFKMTCRLIFILTYAVLQDHIMYVWNGNLQYASMHCTFFQHSQISPFPADLRRLFNISHTSIPSHSRLCPIFFYYRLITP